MSNWAERSNIVINSALSDLDSLLITDPYTQIFEQTAEQRIDNIFRKDPRNTLQYLESWWYTDSLVESFASPLREVLDKNQLTISFEKEELKKYEDFINNKIVEMDLKKSIDSSLYDMIYWGVYFKYLTYNAEKKEFNILDVKNPEITTYVEKLSKPMGFIRQGNFVDISDGIFSSYKLAPVKQVSLDKITIPDLRAKIQEEMGKTFDSKMRPEIVAYTHFRPRSVFWGQVDLLAQIFLNELILQFLALKDSVRQDLITVIVQSLPKKTINTAKVAQSIEEALNQGSNLLVQQDMRSLIGNVIFALFNSARVLPSVENYSSIQKLDLLDLKEKRAQLQAENEELKKQALANLGIPEELQAGTGNRWEILSRSDKYLTAINSYISMADDVVKNTVVSMMRLMGRYCEKSDVNFSFINDTPLQSQMSRNKAALFIDSLRDTMNAINGVKMIVSTGFVDPNKVMDDFLDQIQNWNLPFSTSYYSAEELVAGMNDPHSPISQIMGGEFSEKIK